MNTSRGDGGGFLAGEGEQDVDVVDHEIEDDIDVETAGSEDAEAMDLKKEREREGLFEGENGGVEALKVADLEDAIVVSGGVEQLAGGVKIGSDGFFDEDIEAGGEQGRTDGSMGLGGHGDDRCIGGGAEGVEGVESGNGEFSGGRRGAGGIGVVDAGELRAREIFENAYVIAAEGSCAGDGDADGSECWLQTTSISSAL